MAREISPEQQRMHRIRGAYTFVGGWLDIAYKNTKHTQYLYDPNRIADPETRLAKIETGLQRSFRAYDVSLAAVRGVGYVESVSTELRLSALLMRGLVLGSYDAYRIDKVQRGQAPRAPRRLIERMDKSAELPDLDALSYDDFILESEAFGVWLPGESEYANRFLNMVSLAVADRATDAHGHNIVVDPRVSGQHVWMRLGPESLVNQER